MIWQSHTQSNLSTICPETRSHWLPRQICWASHTDITASPHPLFWPHLRASADNFNQWISLADSRAFEHQPEAEQRRQRTLVCWQCGQCEYAQGLCLTVPALHHLPFLFLRWGNATFKKLPMITCRQIAGLKTSKKAWLHNLPWLPPKPDDKPAHRAYSADPIRSAAISCWDAANAFIRVYRHFAADRLMVSGLGFAADASVAVADTAETISRSRQHFAFHFLKESGPACMMHTAHSTVAARASTGTSLFAIAVIVSSFNRAYLAPVPDCFSLVQIYSGAMR